YNSLVSSSEDDNTVDEEPLDIEYFEATNTDLDLSIDASGDVLRLEYTLNRTLKNGVTLEQLHRYIDLFLSAYAVNSQTKIDDIDYLTPLERQTILHEFNKPDQELPNDNTFIGLFEETVNVYPENIALVDGSDTWTYAELDKIANQLANFLTGEYQLKASSVTGISLPAGQYGIVSILAILKMGRTYLPIDTSFSQERKSYIIQDSSCDFVIEEETIQTFLSNRENIDSQFQNASHLNDRAYILYTSGSTGKPKGVPISHLSLVDYCYTYKDIVNLTSEDRVLQKTTLSFDVSVEEIFPTLAVGAGLVISQNRMDFKAVFEECIKYNVTVVSTNPFFVQYINENCDVERTALRVIVSGGDTLQSKYIDKIWQQVDIYNGYGPTESTVCATYYKVEHLGASVPIGKSIRNRQVYIMSPSSDNLMPIGLVGEICIAGKGLTEGYLNNEKQTAAKFFNNPFNSLGKLYRTGDLGKWLPDGNIEFLGRNDYQVNIRGKRIELEEIEVCILKTGLVSSAGVVVVGDTDNKSLVAYIVPKSTYEKSALVKSLASFLPQYMIPGYFIEQEELPITLNGKIDRKKLAAIEFNVEEFRSKDQIMPRTALEKKLADIWKEILGLDVIGIHDNFFEIGGNSILVMQLKYQLENRFSTQIEIVSLFEHFTIESQALIVSSNHKENSSSTQKEEITEIKF
ncbi:MAG: non-ribosomal peptide synthetase, partial [Bacteroidota bacterium]